MKRKIWFSSWVILMLLTGHSEAQTAFYVGTGSSFYIAPSTTVSIDSLVFIPAAGYTISGENSQQRTNTLMHASFNPFITRVYRWQANLPAFTGTMQFYYREAELNGLSEASLTLNVHNGSSWTAHAPLVRDAAGNFVSTVLTNVVLNELTLANESQALPVRWIHAEARHSNGSNHVSWITADETNCKDYIVEKTTTGSNWTPMDAAVPAHNTGGPNKYNLMDPSAPANLTWYRIRQTDLDGRISYSVVLRVKLAKEISVQAYPNPFNQQFTIAASGSKMKSIQIFNSAGSLVFSANLNDLSNYTINTTSFAAGSYHAVIRLKNDHVISRSIIKD